MRQPSEQPTRLAPRIARHPVNEEGAKKRAGYFDEDLPDRVAAARGNLVRCNSLKIEAREHAAQVLVLRPESPDACRSLRLGAEAVAAIFAGAMATTDQIEVRLGEGPAVRVPSTVTPDLHHAGNWTDGFFMAAICRDRELLDLLCRVPSRIYRSSTTRGLEHTYQFAEALQLYWQREEAAAGRASSALLATEVSGLPPRPGQTTHELSRPAIEVLVRLIEGRADAFNESLARALELHRQFWSRSEEVARDPDGYFSLPLTALAALAHDAGIPITVESDYLPMGLVRGDCRRSA